MHDEFKEQFGASFFSVLALSSQSDRIDLIQAGRAFAALAVVLFHTDTIAQASEKVLGGIGLFALGERGVDFFFVLSGFIIAYAHRHDRTGWSVVSTYAVKRVIRIYPLVWLVASLVIVANLVIDSQMPTAIQVWTSLTLLPSLTWPSPSVSWTLRHELLFYFMFATAFIDRRLGATLLIGWFSGCALQAVLLLSGGGATGLYAFFLSPLNLDFALGIFAALLVDRVRDIGTERLFALLGVVAVLVTCSAWIALDGPQRRVLDYGQVDGVIWDLSFGVAFALLVFALAKFNARIRTPRALIFLGAASYAIYLSHTSTMSLIGRVIPPTLTEHALGLVAVYVILLTVAVLSGAILHMLFEQPATVRLHRLILARKDTAAFAHRSAGYQ